MHGVGIDDGTYTDFATDGGAGFPLFQAGSTGTGGSVKGGPYNKGARGDNGQYGLFEVIDSGTAATAIWTAKDDLNATVTSVETNLIGYPAVGTPITYTFTNSFPLITSLSPADDSSSASVTNNLVMTFNESVQKGTGNISIYTLTNNALVETIDVASAAVTVTGNQMTIDHQINGGLGSAVAEVLVENCPVPMKRIGLKNTFAESGPYLELLKKYEMDAEAIENAVLEGLKNWE